MEHDNGVALTMALGVDEVPKQRFVFVQSVEKCHVDGAAKQCRRIVPLEKRVARQREQKNAGLLSEHLAFWRHCRVDSDHGTRRQGEGIASTHADLQVIAGLERPMQSGEQCKVIIAFMQGREHPRIVVTRPAAARKPLLPSGH